MNRVKVFVFITKEEKEIARKVGPSISKFCSIAITKEIKRLKL